MICPNCREHIGAGYTGAKVEVGNGWLTDVCSECLDTLGLFGFEPEIFMYLGQYDEGADESHKCIFCNKKFSRRK